MEQYSANIPFLIIPAFLIMAGVFFFAFLRAQARKTADLLVINKGLAESENRLRTLFAGMMDGFAHHEIICDAAGIPVDYRFIEINPAFTLLTGLQREEVIGRTVREVMPEVEQAWIEQYGKIALDEGEAQFEQYNAGLNKHFEVHAYSTEHGRFTTIFRDVSDRRVAEKEKEQWQEQQLHEHQVKSALAGLFPYFAAPFRTIEEICGMIRLSAQELTGSSHSYAAVIAPGTSELAIYSFTGMKEGECRIRLDKPHFPCSADGSFIGLLGLSLNSCVPFVCNDPDRHSSALGLLEGRLAIEKYLSVPVMLGEELVGQIAVANPGRDYETRDVNDLQRLAEHFALAIQRLRYEESIREKERRINGIFESSNSGIALLDHSYRVVFANRQMSTLFCYHFSAEEPISYMDLVHPDEREKVMLRKKEIVAGLITMVNSERRYVRGNGEEFRGLVSGRSSFDENGRFEYLVLVITDFTPLKKMEDERRHLQNQLVQSQKLELVGQLAGGVAHDFNNILTGIIGYANLSLIAEPRDQREGHLHNIVELAERAAHLTQSLLTFSRKQPLNQRNSDLNLIVSRMQKIMGRLIGDNVRVEIQTAPGSLGVFVDEQQIDQVIMNLITNAVQAIDRCGVINVRTMLRGISDEEARAINGAREGEFAVIEVEDTGAGISPENLQRIFEPFFTTKDVGKGTGLGLSVIFGIIERHEGFILVDSTPGEGSIFSVFLPLLQNQDRENPEQSDTLPVRGSETILVADDSHEVRDIVTYILQEFGYTVLAAENGIEAVEMFRQNRGRVDLLLFDMSMPDMSGLEAYNVIDADAPDIRCLFMTGNTTQEQMVETENLGMPLVLKPLSPKEILLKVREVLDYGKSE